MSLTFKLASLVIRTVAKPIGNRIKQSAREHDTFRRYCVSFAQGLHRIDMRMRLGILHDAAAQERMHAREAAEAAAKKRQTETPTVRTEAQQKADDMAAADLKDKESKAPPKPRIRPLSESRAIELGANFLSESFIFGVAVGLLVWDQWRTRRKENTRREGIDDRLEALEDHTRQIVQLQSEVDRLKTKYEPLSNPAEPGSVIETKPATIDTVQSHAPTRQADTAPETKIGPAKGAIGTTSLAEESQ
ncbi:hypothetical protein E4T42_00402 [Aureobasidium subglaciale]|uniref:OPA3-like protein n=1 Tax=Aureobasidium subglaciale (strain EXF-2481) TaxID=1043005 RepID=A0A074ZKN6_AURSE|nr:uncharacterized protein AUEXF2481DRAFT_389175 [Aureobasidium subglaciale EXF-2481]KAI5205640.1 hypothetical protein E4T38_04218 [Aureobasidium subglaciale]KAI5224598.1 hypothetical protein E4T40_03971 [Aureobasidium subglaciale]KAI5227735.1 hypothetical protein E4T41_04191 [Aureobasidium subglaciale]KAI5258799.1 hypothetical protein E4T42_00402 [Aureobasidium subglaciale]KAI5263229.1 hypothetical protein E4T46_03812 [Aureobasidium subglaciale]